MADQTWRGCVVPDDLLYDVDHNVWVRFDGEDAVLGMTDVAQTMCGKFVNVSWKAPGKAIRRGKPLAIIESAKWVGPFPAPFSGTIVATNQAAFDDDLTLANRDPYGAGWLIRLRPDDPASDRDRLVDGATAYARYKQIIEEHDIHCFRCAE